MLITFVHYALPFAFTLLVACVFTCLVSGIFLAMFRLRLINQAMQHPYLNHQAWDRYPFPIRLAILLDYFLRLTFPKSRFWIIGNANRLLAHVQPEKIPTRIKWPLLGLWGGCFVGIIAMVALWILLLLAGTL
ncbi:hypothetical protein GSY71_11395 [Pusillimonas sp. TS35]|uniref:hypothetical protein n=1 Tax=Paracandidimonas lactea TaxID=2895524 RepID=UPI0013690917|nr:hypothetical protein [Paracandidimonas lactea]MYN13740.1 hypothetical protein [Pusillimonas sp. TS35]